MQRTQEPSSGKPHVPTWLLLGPLPWQALCLPTPTLEGRPVPQLARPPCAYASELSLLLCFAHCLGFPTFISDSSHLAPTPGLWALCIQPYYHLILTTFSSSQTQAADVVLLLYDYPVLIKIMGHALSNPGGWTVWTRRVWLSCHHIPNWKLPHCWALTTLGCLEGPRTSRVLLAWVPRPLLWIPSLPTYLLASSLHDMTLEALHIQASWQRGNSPSGAVLQNISKTQRSAVFQEECQVTDNLLADPEKWSHPRKARSSQEKPGLGTWPHAAQDLGCSETVKSSFLTQSLGDSCIV